jgi:hypothetical protein
MLTKNGHPPHLDHAEQEKDGKKLLTQSRTRYTFMIAVHMGRLQSAIGRAHLSFPASYFELRLIA